MADFAEIGGIVFSPLSLDEAARAVISAAREKTPYLVVTPNATMLHDAFRNEALYSHLSSAELVLPDGAGVVWAAKALGHPLPSGKIAGVELGERVAQYAANEGLPLFLFGAKPSVAISAKEALTRRYPNLLVAGCRDGYHFDTREVANEIKLSGAEIVFCCLGSPLQEEVGRYLTRALSCPVLCLGGSLDVYAGCVRRAPKFFRALSLEWLWRMLQEPRRFSGVFSLFAFLYDVRRLKKAKKSCNRLKKRL